MHFNEVASTTALRIRSSFAPSTRTVHMRWCGMISYDAKCDRLLVSENLVKGLAECYLSGIGLVLVVIRHRTCIQQRKHSLPRRKPTAFHRTLLSIGVLF